MLTKISKHGLLRLCLSLCIYLGLQSPAQGGRCMQRLASQKGVAITAIVYAGAAGISSLLWAIDFHQHFGMREDISHSINEWGGITAGIESIVLAMIIPIWAYEYIKHHPQTPTPPIFIPGPVPLPLSHPRPLPADVP